MQTPLAAADGEGRNSDGFELVGDWPGADRVVKLPELSVKQIEQLRAELLAKAPQDAAKYDDLFDPKDQEALDEAQVVAMMIYEEISKRVFAIKQAYVRGALTLGHINKSGVTHQIPTVSEVYRSYMKGKINEIMKVLDTGEPDCTPRSYGATQTFQSGYEPVIKISGIHRCEIAFHKDASGKIDRVIEPIWPKKLELESVYDTEIGISGKCVPLAEGEPRKYDKSKFKCSDDNDYSQVPTVDRVILGTNDISDWQSGRWKSMSTPSFTRAAYRCKTEVCVMEIEKMALELQQEMYSWNRKYEFDDENVDSLKLFFEPKNTWLVHSLSSYIDNKLKNHEVNAFRYAVTSLTNLLYVPLIAPVDFLSFITQLKVERSTFDFRPNYLACDYGSRNWYYESRWTCRHRKRQSNRRERVMAPYDRMAREKLQGLLQ